MELDSQLLLSVATAALAMAAVFHFQARSFPLSIKGIGRWSLGFGAVFLAMVVAASRVWLPDSLTILLSSLLVQAGLLFLLQGLLAFNGYQTFPYWTFVPVAINALGLIVFQYVYPLLWARIAVSCATNVALALPMLYVVCKGYKRESWRRFSRWYPAVVMVGMITIWLLRGGWAIHVQPVSVPPVPQELYRVLSLVFPWGVVAFAAGLTFMAFDRLRDELEYLVSHDVLTGAYSRRGFLDLAESEVSRSQRMQRPVSLMLLDLDHFKELNERYGHPAGDLVLQRFAEITRSCLRREDLFGRFGGEEFMVLLPDTPPNAARVVAERIRASIFASRVNASADKSHIRFSVSVGISITLGRGSLEDLLRGAEDAIHLAKTRGRNRVEMAG